MDGRSCDEIKVLVWNIMGSTKPGWAAARLLILLCNILGHDLVFLQEVQWVERSLQKLLTLARAGYELVMTSSKHNNRNTCILYNAMRLQLAKEDTEAVTATLKSVKGWRDDHSKRLCVQVFSLQGKGDASKFAAISLHAPKGIQDNKSFCDLVKAGIEKVVADHKLPVLVGGDFNTDIHRWKDDGFQGVDYEAGRSPIDFITMKVPGPNNHLTMGKVQKLKQEEIKIPENAEGLPVELQDGSEMTLKKYKDKGADNLCRHLFGGHMPLTVPVLYHNNVISTEGNKDEIKTWEELVEENARLTEELKRFKANRKRKQQQPEMIKKKLKCESYVH